MATYLTHAEAIARASLLRVDSIGVALDLTAGTDTFRSRTEIRFARLAVDPDTADAAAFADLDARSVRQILLNGKSLESGSIADGRLPLPGLATDNVLIVDADFDHSQSGAGLATFTDPADGSDFALVTCFPTATPRVFCCFDQPDLRADLTLTVTAPAGWECVANGAVIERPAPGTGGTWRFAPARAMKPYEFTLCAGPYVTAARVAATAANPELTVRCRPALAESAGLPRIAEIVGRAVSAHQEFLGVPCPYDRLDIVCAPELSPLAMQLPAVMYVGESLLQRAADAQDDFVAEVLAHEAAHLWFGCLVEGAWWDDLWLAEAMASYLSYTACTHVLGQPDAWAEFAMTGKAGAYQTDSLPGSQPVSSPVDSAASALMRHPAIAYNKGASVIRQLAALIGDEAMRAGLADYLTRFAWSATSLSELVGCWSTASGRDLTGWARQWLTEPGVATLRPELDVAPDGTIRAAAVLQDPPLRQHRIQLGAYEHRSSHHGRTGLTRTHVLCAEVSGSRTVVSELAGQQMPAALVLNDSDLTFARVRFDERSLRALIDATVTLGDPLTEAVCWNALWDMVTSAELDPAEFAGLVSRWLDVGAGPATTAEQLMSRATAAADRYAYPARRGPLLQRQADAALEAASRAEPGSRRQRVLATGFAASADSQDQLAALRAWLNRAEATQPPRGVTVTLDLRAAALANLAARDLATTADLAAYAAADPVAGDTLTATCAARRPGLAAKDTAWGAALRAGQSLRLARAHAEGIWVPGQESLLEPFRDRYFTEALPALSHGRDARTAQRLARALYPSILADDATLAATDRQIEHSDLSEPIRAVLIEQRAVLHGVIAARAAFPAPSPATA
ncbi:MAG TPA: aminopeptidase N [Streptosporangiaceae bacterium]